MGKWLTCEEIAKWRQQEYEKYQREKAKAEGREYPEPTKATYTLPKTNNIVAYMYEVAGTLD